MIVVPALSNPPVPYRTTAFWLGLVLVAMVAGLSMALAAMPVLTHWGLSALTLAIVLGMVLGNTAFPPMADRTGAGVDFAKGTLLRAGIVLYGFRLTFQQIADVGQVGLLTDVAMVASVFGLAVLLGTRVFRLDRQTSMLIGAGSAICGAAAVLATEPIVRAQAHKVSVAVSTVVVFGTLAMFLYPWLYPHLGFDPHAYGVFAGSTIHEVAQVVVAGKAVGDVAAASAVIEKMLRVMLLAPFLLLLSMLLRRREPTDGPRAPLQIPWFAVLFVVVAGFNSLHWLPASWVDAITHLDTALLAMAMVGLGLRTHAGAIRQAGAAPLLLAACLFVYLVVGGWLVNVAIARLGSMMG